MDLTNITTYDGITAFSNPKSYVLIDECTAFVNKTIYTNYWLSFLLICAVVIIIWLMFKKGMLEKEKKIIKDFTKGGE